MNAEHAWQSVLGQLQMEMPRASYETWVRDTKPVSFDAGVMTVAVRNAYARDWLDSRLAATVNRMLMTATDSSVTVNFVVASGADGEAGEADPAEVQPEAPPAEPRPRSLTLNPRYTFDTFVVGAGNRLAHAACQAVAEKPARAYNPLFLYGGVGLGKTHLLHAIGNACNARGLNVLYVSSEEFTNDLISAIRTHTTQAFRDKYRSADVLLIDDIQFIAGKESTQEEFFHTFNTLHGQDKQIIVSSDRPPKSLVTLEERLRSRFEWGLAADIQAPDLETRLAILRSKAERTGRFVPDEVLQEIARRVQSNIRELEGALNRIIAFADLSGSTLNASLVDVALADLLPQRGELQPQVVIDVVARFFNLTAEKLLSADRSKNVSLPRQLAMYILREDVKASLPQIGEVVGGRDHTTVMHGIKKIESDIKNDDRMQRQLMQIRQQLYGQQVSAI
ncbi:MAG: chromosomal replication initiator protein DnaA [Anaerolineaceae bacterium]|jgi:chromosomal replication initiator protein|nr:chromosomal replication initiator protein DnaA [Chloroflexota bacterium]MCC7511595.1 chromosomal replication initiator protein DnaA [Anaerolineae bacterium]MCE7918018.1 chromosomal replication initiator protein DnaA [Chloroflexi bacterium CFX1]MCZ2289591.1 chromosomal replication initiator protein DnaA [Anaerolineales bacterium]OQY83999.1 MAG: chromosomal replication initiation protein DnaA [Anaerolineae bacterium UTCFX3]GJQ38181.1 MAG: chromosomal replication initiator protein DnaA [Anaero